MCWMRVKGVWETLASRFERATFPAWLLAVAAIGGLFYGVADRTDKRVKRAEELYAEYQEKVLPSQYLDSEVVEEIAIRQRCLILLNKNHLPEDVDCSMLTEDQSKLVFDVQLQTDDRKVLRQKIDDLRKDVPLDESVARQHLAFFEKVRQCAEHGSCDEMTARSLFRNAITIYLNNICVYVAPGRMLQDLEAETVAVANFLRGDDGEDWTWWSEDKGRENPFFCLYLR